MRVGPSGLSDDSGFWLRVKAEDASHSFVKLLTAPAPCSRGTEASKVELPAAPSKLESRKSHRLRIDPELIRRSAFSIARKR